MYVLLNFWSGGFPAGMNFWSGGFLAGPENMLWRMCWFLRISNLGSGGFPAGRKFDGWKLITGNSSGVSGISGISDGHFLEGL